MRGSADMAEMRDVGSRRIFFRFETVCQDQPLEMELESTPAFSHSEMRAARDPFFGTTFGRIFSRAFLTSSSVVAFCGPHSDGRNGVCFATSCHTWKIIAPEALHSRAVVPSIRRDASSEGERRMKDTDHPIRHPLRHFRLFGNVRSRRSCTWRDDQFGRGQNTGLGWSDPTFVHVSVPKVIRGVAPAQLRGDRAECLSAQHFAAGGHSDEQRRRKTHRTSNGSGDCQNLEGASFLGLRTYAKAFD
jgi:hypothetical protein